jgi:O-antigen ligase
MVQVKNYIERFLNIYLSFVAFTFAYLISYIPFLTEVSTLRSPYIVAMYYAPFFLVVIWFKDMISIKEIRYYLGVICIAIITFVWTIEPTKGITNIYLLIQALLCAFLISYFGYRKFWSFFSWGLFVFSILLKFKVLYFFLDTYNYDGNRLGYIDGQFALDPNFFGLFLGLSLFYFVTETFQKQTYKVNRVYTLLNGSAGLLILYFLVSTLSRTITLSLILVVGLYVLALSYKGILKLTKRQVLFGGLSIIFALIVVTLIVLNTSLISRFSNLFKDDRFEIWSIILNIMSSLNLNSVFGYGLGSSDLIIGRYFPGAVIGDDGLLRFSAHNLYLDWLLQTGYIGLIYLLLVIGLYIRKTLISHKRNFLTDAFLIGSVILICSFGINTFGHYSWPVLIGLMLGSIIPKYHTRRK